MIKGKFIEHKKTVLIVWTGRDAMGIGKPIGPKNCACKYSTAAHRALLDKGVKFTNRFVDAYPFPGHYENPRACQKEMLDFQLRHSRAYNLSEMRTGKSAPVAWHIDIGIKYNNRKKFLIIAPLSTLEDTWRSELFGICTKTAVFYSIHGTDGVRKLKKALLRQAKSDKPYIFVINFDKVWRCVEELMQFDPEMVFIDEASDLNDPETKKYKALDALMRDPKRDLLALTGTPTPNRPSDVWAVARWINPKTPRRWGHLRNLTMEKEPWSQYKWVSKPNANQIIGELMTPSIRFRTDDVDDMPDHEGVSVHVPMSNRQEVMFQEMKEMMITQDKGKTITAEHAGARLWKLLQIASGVCRDAEGNLVMMGAGPKIEELKRLIRETPKKTVIMSSFTAVQHYIINELKGQYKIGHINGGTPAKDRKKILDRFQNGDLDVLVCHPRPTRYGLKMHAASQMVWFGPVYSALDFEQGSFRIRGPGTGKTIYVKLSASKLEQEIYSLIESRMQNQQDSMTIAQGLTQVYTSLFEGSK